MWLWRCGEPAARENGFFLLVYFLQLVYFFPHGRMRLKWPKTLLQARVSGGEGENRVALLDLKSSEANFRQRSWPARKCRCYYLFDRPSHSAGHGGHPQQLSLD